VYEVNLGQKTKFLFLVLMAIGDLGHLLAEETKEDILAMKGCWEVLLRLAGSWIRTRS